MKNNKPIIVTSPDIYNDSLVKSLQEEGFKTISLPIIETIIIDNPDFNKISNNLNKFTHIILPSKTAINSFITHIQSRGISLNDLTSIFIAIGKDVQYLKERNFKNIASPIEPSTQGIVNYLTRENRNLNLLVFIPKVEIIQEPYIIPDMLKKLKNIGETTIIEAYITKPVMSIPEEIKERIYQNNYELLAITSGGEALAIQYFFPEFYRKIKIACFGPYTMRTARNNGFLPILTGTKFHSFQDFALQIKSYLNKQ
jgi:uroporphyrinogen-III synthase